MKKYTSLLLLVIGLIAGGLFVKQFYAPSIQQKDATILLKSVRKVLKLVTVEGEFSEDYNQTNIKPITLYLPLPATFNFSKTANIHVTGKALVGYNLEKMAVTVDDNTKTLTISNIPEPEILAIEHDLRYKFLDESFFNAFTPNDYTQLNINAKNAIKETILDGELVEKAKQQGNDVIDVIKIIVEGAGWNFVVDGQKDIFIN